MKDTSTAALIRRGHAMTLTLCKAIQADSGYYLGTAPRLTTTALSQLTHPKSGPILEFFGQVVRHIETRGVGGLLWPSEASRTFDRVCDETFDALDRLAHALDPFLDAAVLSDLTTSLGIFRSAKDKFFHSLLPKRALILFGLKFVNNLNEGLYVASLLLGKISLAFEIREQFLRGSFAAQTTDADTLEARIANMECRQRAHGRMLHQIDLHTRPPLGRSSRGC